MAQTPFSELADLCTALEATTKRNEKSELIAGFLSTLNPEEIAPAVLLVVGSIFPEFDPRALEVGWRTVKRALEGGKQTTLFSEPLTIKRVHETLGEIADAEGTGSRRTKTALLEGMINDADSSEADVLVRIIFGEMRIGVNEGVMLEGIAEAADVETSLARRALMLTGDLGKVAEIALTSGREGLKEVKMNLFTPLKPMLASMSYDISEVIREHGGETAFEHKLDGARIQIHGRGEEVRIFSRSLSDVTESLPDIVGFIREQVSTDEVVLEGEALAIGERGRPLPFQDLMRRFRRVHEVEGMMEKIPLELHLFDVLYHDGVLLIDEPYQKRRSLLEKICPPELIVERIVTADPVEAQNFLDGAIRSGHEGLMAKRLDSVYTPGSRGKRWFKIKPAETLDLVVVAADWGYGRRTGWLSNYHLAARDGGEYRVLGKSFKGLNDEEFRWMTEKLQALKVRETRGTVHVRPELVVEVAFNEIQRSPHYRSGFALRFARITRIREDKSPGEADTLRRVRELYEAQFRYKARAEF
ncbi:MAG: ATP-dependent DNA ligase [Candidatus Bathyarchaeota archaeon]|jgi:DNA ligase-1